MNYQSFIEWSKRSWRILVAGAAFIFCLSIGLLLYAIYAPSTEGFASPYQEIIESSSDRYARNLDGVYVSSTEETARTPIAVMVENSYEAWPLSGVADANVVFEAPVEGSITRFMLLYDPTTTSTEIGPVRSARPYYVDFAESFGAVYGHVGGSPAALEQIRQSDSVLNIDEFYYGRNAFWRSENRSAPHNTYTTVEMLSSVAEEEEYMGHSFDAWTYSDNAPSFATEFMRDITVPYLGAYRAHWVYDAETSTYTRYQNGIVERDRDGAIVKANTIVLLLTDAEVVDNVGRLKLRTTGTGTALVFRNGTVQEGVWRRQEDASIRFESVDGRDLFLARGKVWVSLLTDDERFGTILSED